MPRELICLPRAESVDLTARREVIVSGGRDPLAATPHVVRNRGRRGVACGGCRGEASPAGRWRELSRPSRGGRVDGDAQHRVVRNLVANRATRARKPGGVRAVQDGPAFEQRVRGNRIRAHAAGATTSGRPNRIPGSAPQSQHVPFPARDMVLPSTSWASIRRAAGRFGSPARIPGRRPVVDPQLMSHPDDAATLLRGFKIARQIQPLAFVCPL